MSAHVIQAFAVCVHRDVRNGVDLAAAVERRTPPETKAEFIEAMKADLANGLRRGVPQDIVSAALREEFTEMGLPVSWIAEVLQ